MKFAICNETWFGSGAPDVASMLDRLIPPPPLRPKFVRFDNFARVCDSIASHGYEGVEVAPFTLCYDPSELNEADGSRFGEIARRAGLEITGLHWLLLRPPGFHLTTTDDGIRHRTAEFALTSRRALRRDGRKSHGLGQPEATSPRSGMEPRRRHKARGGCPARGEFDTAGELGVTLAIEPLARTETNFLTTAAETISLIKMVNHPACRLHLDVKAMSDEAAVDSRHHPRQPGVPVHFHANDPNLRGPGTGNRPIRTDLLRPARNRLRRLGLGRGLRLHPRRRHHRPRKPGIFETVSSRRATILVAAR